MMNKIFLTFSLENFQDMIVHTILQLSCGNGKAILFSESARTLIKIVYFPKKKAKDACEHRYFVCAYYVMLNALTALKLNVYCGEVFDVGFEAKK